MSNLSSIKNDLWQQPLLEPLAGQDLCDISENAHLKHRLADRLEECFRTAELYFNRHFKRATFDLDIRGQNAGLAFLQDNHLRFNVVMLANHTDDFLLQTVAHEVAHLVTHQMYGRYARPHGAEWKAVMVQAFGLNPNRCHQYSVEKRKQREYLYLCHCPAEIPLSIRRHNAVGRGARYICRECRHELAYSGIERFS